jgi:predicted Zn-dependent peptidase
MFDQYFSDPGRLNTEVERFRAVTRIQVQELAEEFLSPENRAFLTYVPGEAS